MTPDTKPAPKPVISELVHDAQAARWGYVVAGLSDVAEFTILSFDDRPRAELSLMAMRAGNSVLAMTGAHIAHADGL